MDDEEWREHSREGVGGVRDVSNHCFYTDHNELNGIHFTTKKKKKQEEENRDTDILLYEWVHGLVNGDDAHDDR